MGLARTRLQYNTYGRCNKWCGFREGRSCLNNIFTLNALVQDRLVEKEGKLLCLFVDFKRAFPSFDHGLLWETLKRIGFNSELLKILMCLYSKAKMYVKKGSDLSERWTYRGFYRGNPLVRFYLRYLSWIWRNFEGQEE